jgi:hypothetical protein
MDKVQNKKEIVSVMYILLVQISISVTYILLVQIPDVFIPCTLYDQCQPVYRQTD